MSSAMIVASSASPFPVFGADRVTKRKEVWRNGEVLLLVRTLLVKGFGRICEKQCFEENAVAFRKSCMFFRSCGCSSASSRISRFVDCLQPSRRKHVYGFCRLGEEKLKLVNDGRQPASSRDVVLQGLEVEEILGPNLCGVGDDLRNFGEKCIDGENHKEEKKCWTPHDSKVLYRIPGWGAPYFSINACGRICARPYGTSDGSDELDIVELIESLKGKNVQLPMVIRFPDIVRHRIEQLQTSFSTAIKEYGYQRHFQGVFPIKCNHDRYLVEDIVEFGQQYHFGLEAGSKPELLIAMAKLRKGNSALLICNGYKDRVYIECALSAKQLGINAVIVLEQMEELDLVIECSRSLGVKPLLGVRARLSTKHQGHWGETSGDNGKFGLRANEMVRVVYTLRHEDMLDCLQLLHFHVGSQISSISIIKEAMREGSHTYCELALMGAPMGYIDVGGGLGIDYDGTQSQSTASTNYTMQNYANDVVAALMDACLLKGVDQPIIVSESGRALASHHSVLVFDVLSASHRSEESALSDIENLARHTKASVGVPAWGNADRDSSEGSVNKPRHGEGEYLLSTFFEVYSRINQSNYQEAFNDAKQFKLEAGSLFKLGCLSLEQRAQANALYEAVCHRVLSYSNRDKLPVELQSLSKSMAAVYHVNMSVFRSAPDAWAIDQIFPVIPLHRLDEMPTTEATLADLTCDSDGKFDKFVGVDGGISSVLPVHDLRDGEPYYFGLFLGGVYQEVLGSPHNLFGGTNVVHVRSMLSRHVEDVQASTSGGGYSIERVIKGQTMEEVLRTMQHNGDDMVEDLCRGAKEAVANGLLSNEDAQTLLHNYKCNLGSYTYLSR